MAALGAVVEDTTPAKPSLYGLLSPAVDVQTDLSPYWVNGFDYSSLDCSTEVRLHLICNSNVEVTAVEPSEGSMWRKYFPFSIDTEFKCSTMGMRPEEVRQVAEQRLDACTQHALEFEFWTGALAREAANDESWDELDDGEYPNRYLASEDAEDVTPTPGTGVRIKHAIARLEGALARSGCGIQGVLHMPVEVASAAGLKVIDGILQTQLGTPVIAGSGYTGSGPGDVEPSEGELWIYATGPVSVRVGGLSVTSEKVNQSVDIAKNTTVYYADKPGAVTWDSCAHFGVLVDLTLDFA